MPVAVRVTALRADANQDRDLPDDYREQLIQVWRPVRVITAAWSGY